MKLCFLVDLSNDRFFRGYKSLIEDFLKELGVINLLDVSKILKKRNNSKEILRKYNPKILQPDDYSELKDILRSNRDMVYFYGISNNLEYFFINYYCAKYKIKTLLISNLGYNPFNYNYLNKKKIFRNLNTFIKIRLKIYYLRILSILGLTPKIDYFFEASEYIYKSVSNGLSSRIAKKIPILNFSYYKKIIKINSKHFDAIYYSKYKISEKYIVFIDGIFEHEDRIIREGKVSEESEKKYYDNLYKVLNNFKIIFDKEIIVCLHPKNNSSEKRGMFKDLKCIKYETEKYISESFVVFFHESSAILQAITQKKRIISLYGELMGNYINKRCEMYSSIFKLHKISLDDVNFDEKFDIINKLNNSVKNYDEYINKNIINDPSKSGVMQVIEFLNLKS